jgi:hypothetical protein
LRYQPKHRYGLWPRAASGWPIRCTRHSARGSEGHAVFCHTLVSGSPRVGNDPPAEPEAFRLLAPQRGLIATEQRQTLCAALFRPFGSRTRTSARTCCRKCQTAAASPAEPGGLSCWLVVSPTGPPGLRADYYDLNWTHLFSVPNEGPIDHRYDSARLTDSNCTAGQSSYYQGKEALWADRFNCWSVLRETLTGFLKVENTGPIPWGVYNIGNDNRRTGPLSLPLRPIPGTPSAGRPGGYYIHGCRRPGQVCSQGCVVVPRSARQTIENSGGGTLMVSPNGGPPPVFPLCVNGTCSL